ncbi:hypothetical protein VB780_06990 [Leptolyngbya sp. CCNP1308]|nr:hypothetical protein [Leptolyngbya sp. CCNP1308]MEA5448306.1 hypothetical protein [Leptolyngbya sp. CCNP1308]
MVDSKAAARAFKTAVVSHLNQVAPVTARAMFGMGCTARALCLP